MVHQKLVYWIYPLVLPAQLVQTVHPVQWDPRVMWDPRVLRVMTAKALLVQQALLVTASLLYVDAKTANAAAVVADVDATTAGIDVDYIDETDDKFDQCVKI